MSGWLLAIDFGTSFTTAAVRRDGGTPEILRFQGQDDPQRLPSLVLVDEDGRLRVGEDAWAEAALHPGRLLRAPKSHLGEREPYRLEARRVAPVEAVAAVLRAVWEEALKQHGGDEPGEVRLSHPASWARERKTALADAARAAGMEAVTLAPPEPVAAAVQCAGESTREGKQRVPVGGYAAVYDLGGGTFDAAVVRRTGEDSFEVVGEPRGVDDLGGELFDQRLQERLRQTLAHQSEEASATLTDSVRLRHEFLSKVRHAKERLARSPSASFAVHGLPDFHVTREEFDGLIRAYIEESAGILEATVREALGDAGELSAVFLVGGSSRIQLVADTLRARARFAGKVVAAPGDPKSVVALGAARYVPQAEPGPAELRAPDDLLALLRLWQGGVLPAVERRSQALAEALGELTTPERIAGDRLELRLRFDMTRFSTAAEALADAAFQERLLDCVAETDERLMERYLSGELIEPEAALRELVGDIRLRAALFEVTRARLVPRIDVPRSGQPLPGVLTQDAPLAPAALSAAGHEKLRGFDAALHAEFERAAQSLGADAEVAWGELHPSAAAHIRQSPLGADTESDAVSAEKIQWWISLAQRRAAGGGIQWHAMSSSERADLLTIVAVRGRVFLQDDLPPDPRPAFRNLTLASGDCRTKAPLDRLVPELAHAVDPSERLHVALVGWESFESYGTPSGFGRRPPRGQRAFRIFCTSRGRFIIARTKAVIDDRAAPPDVQPAAILEADLPPVSVTQEDLFRCELEGFHRPSRSGTLLTGHVRLHLAARDLDKRLWGRRRSLSGMAFRFAHYWDDEVEVLRYALRELRPEPGRGL